MKTKLVLLASCLCMFGCASLVSPVAQGAFDTVAETATTAVLANNPTDLNAVINIASALPGAFSGAITSAGVGQVIGQLGKQNGASSNTILTLASAFDGAFRNYAAQQGGATGSVPTLQAAIAQQILDVFADGMFHSVQLYEGSKGLPITPIPSFTGQAAAQAK
jgi:hypothetical protein